MVEIYFIIICLCLKEPHYIHVLLEEPWKTIMYCGLLKFGQYS